MNAVHMHSFVQVNAAGEGTVKVTPAVAYRLLMQRALKQHSAVIVLGIRICFSIETYHVSEAWPQHYIEM